uniref:SHSP domain-containing protein n=1 Tax=Davidia involucrata TaxID=16924 RepID=A0A5B7BZ69_DAVIN
MMVPSTALIRAIGSSRSLFTSLLRFNGRSLAVAPPSLAAVRSFHTGAPTDNPTVGKANAHFEKYLELLESRKHPFMTQGPKCPTSTFENKKARCCIRIDMPGVGKEGLKVWFEGDRLKLEGVESEKDPHYDKESVKRVYCAEFDIDPLFVNKDNLKAIIRNGVLRIMLPLFNSLEELNIYNFLKSFRH